MTRVDILMATYNGEKYLTQQLDSLLAQTYSDFCLIICDDGSSDSTVDILTAYAQKDERIQLFNNEINLGYNRNFEKLISLSTANYFAFSDQDDIWLPHQLEVLVREMNRQEVDVVYGQSSYINEAGQHIKCREYMLPIKVKAPSQLYDDNIVSGRNMLVHSRLKKYILPFPNLSRQFIYDWYITLVAIQHHGVSYCDTIINQYRVHQKSVTNADLYAPLKCKGFKQKLLNVEKMRFEAVNSRLNRIKIFETFILDRESLRDYEDYIKTLYTTKYINLQIKSFLIYMKAKAPYNKLVCLLIFHFPIIYRFLILKELKLNRGEA